MFAAIERHDARVVNHLRHHDDVILGLDDLNVVVVGARRERRSGVEAENAAFAERPILGAIRWSALFPRGRAGACPLLRFGGQRRHPAVCRVDHDRRLAGAGHPRPPVVPEIVIGAVDVRRGAALPAFILLGIRRRLLLDLRDIVVAQYGFFSEGGWPLERCDVREAPRSLKVGFAVGRAGNRRLRRRRRSRLCGDSAADGRRDDECGDKANRSDDSVKHASPPDQGF